MSNPIDAEAEVAKLQELVRKLQQQNDVLRSTKPGEEGPCLVSPSTNNSNSVEREQCQRTQPDDETGSTCSAESGASRRRLSKTPQEEDSWLYRVKSGEVPNVSALEWMRNSFTSSGGGLLCRLDELDMTGGRLTSSGSSPAIYQLERNGHCSEGDLLSSAPRPAIKPTLLQPPSGGFYLHEQSAGSRVDTNTFTRPKKQRQSVLGMHRAAPSAPTLTVAAEGSCEDLDKMKDMTDVRVIARMQEASLKAQVMAGGNAALSQRSRTGSQHSVASTGSDDSSPPINVVPLPGRIPRKSLPNLGFLSVPGSRQQQQQINQQRRSPPSPLQQAPIPSSAHQRTLSSPMRVPTANTTGAVRRSSTGIPRPGAGRFYLPASGAGDHYQPHYK